MRKMGMGVVLTVIVALLAVPVWAGQTSDFLKNNRSKKTEPVTLGRWHCNYQKCKDYAVKNGVPMIAVWSNGDACSHCTKFENALNTSKFKTWMAKSGCVFYFTYPGDGGDGKEGSKVFHEIRGDNTSYPFVYVLWKVGDSTKVKIHTVGDVVDGNANGNNGAANAINYFVGKDKGVIRKYKPKPVTPKYTGGVFDVDDGSMEAEIGTTTQVEFTVTRTNSTAIASVSTNTVTVTYPKGALTNGLPQQYRIDWEKGGDSVSLTQPIPVSGLKIGDRIVLTLLDAAGKGVQTNGITIVKEPENSPKNPRWIGERTAETLEWGEWTMDIDAATNKVKSFNSPALVPNGPDPARAYTLLLIGGPLWCPDCINAEEKLFATSNFNEWARAKHVACVAIDEPPFAAGLEAPTLLSREKGPSWAAEPSGGVGYISRKMVPMTGNGGTNAEEILQRNLDYVNNDTEHGGFCSPDNLGDAGNTGVWKTGIPCVIALRDDGTVAGRLYQFSNDFRSDDKTNTPVTVLLKRLDELFDQVDDPNEDLNDSRRTTRETVGRRETVTERTLSFTDGADVYRLSPDETQGKRIAVTVNAAAGTQLAIDILTVSGGKEKVVASASSDEYPLTASAQINSSEAYARVCYLTDENGYSTDPQFALDNRDSTVFPYEVKTDFVVQPTDVAEIVELTDRPFVMVSLESNQTYRITNLADGNGNFEPLGDDLYLALCDGDRELELTQLTTSIQKWNPGTVGFSIASAAVSESTESYSIRLIRRGGVSGRATVNLSTNAVKSSTYDGLIELPYDFGEDIVWEEGDGSEKSVEIAITDNMYADGDQVFYFEAAVSGDADSGISEFKLTLRDNDKRLPGKIAIVGASPSFAKGMTQYARCGDTVTFDVRRIGGADGVQEVRLTATAGTLSASSLKWENREVSPKYVNLTLPNAGSSVTVEMKPAKGSSVDSARRIAKVSLLASDAPCFLGDAYMVDATRYVPFGPYYVELDSFTVKDWSKVSVALLSGSLPAGVTWRYRTDSRNVEIRGVPTKAGECTAVFRVSEGTKKGTTTAVTLTVCDPAVTGGGDKGDQPLNAAVALSRTYADVPVWDADAKSLAGLLTLTLPRTGKASAKFATPFSTKATSLSAKNWDKLEDDGTLTVTLKGKSASGEAVELAVRALPDGTVEAELDGTEVKMPETEWTKKNPATDFKGYYTVQLPISECVSGNILARGCGYLTLKMNTATAINAGKFAYAGILPSGKAVSGSATLAARDWLDDPDFLYWSRGVLPILGVSAADSLAGAVEINPGAWDPEAKSYDGTLGVATGRCYHKIIRRVVRPAKECEGLVWSHEEKSDDASGVAVLDAMGCWYDATEDFLSCCDISLGSGTLSFFALEGLNDLPEGFDERLAKGRWNSGETNVIAGVKVTFAKASKSAKTKTSAITTMSATKLPLSFTLSTGIVSGTFKLPMETGSVTFSYKGVVMPGFGYGACTACGIDSGSGGIEAAMSPFIAGSAWVNDTLEYEDAKGKSRTLTVRRSTPFTVGVLQGE